MGIGGWRALRRRGNWLRASTDDTAEPEVFRGADCRNGRHDRPATASSGVLRPPNDQPVLFHLPAGPEKWNVSIHVSGWWVWSARWPLWGCRCQRRPASRLRWLLSLRLGGRWGSRSATRPALRPRAAGSSTSSRMSPQCGLRRWGSGSMATVSPGSRAMHQ